MSNVLHICFRTNIIDKKIYLVCNELWQDTMVSSIKKSLESRSVLKELNRERIKTSGKQVKNRKIVPKHRPKFKWCNVCILKSLKRIASFTDINQNNKCKDSSPIN